MKPEEVLAEGNKRLKEIFNKHREFGLIEEKIKLTQDVTSIDVETISSSMSMMTAYLSNLAGVVPRYTSLANSQYIYRKFSLMWEFSRLGNTLNTIKDKENESLKNTEEEHFEELVARYVADYLKSKYDSYEKHASVLQSRLGILKSELFRSNT